MRKILIIGAGAIAALILVLVIVVALRPSTFRIERATTTAAPPAAVFAEVNDFHKWEAWSPWAKLDPKAVNSFEGPAAGTGAIFRWKGNSEVGAGSMTILESKPGELVRIRLDFLEPMPGTSTADFFFVPTGSGSTVTWAMYGENNFVGKAMCMVMDMDNMVGSQFEKGLAGLRRVAEAKTAPASATTPTNTPKP